MAAKQDNAFLLEVRDLRTSFITEAGVIPAVDGISLSVPHGKTVALVGESGCGKSVTALSIMRLIPQPPGKIVSGQVLLNELRSQEHAHASVGMPPAGPSRTNVGMPPAGPSRTNVGMRRTGTTDLLKLSEKQMREIRGGRITMIFQEPQVSLNPVYTIGEQIVEAIELHQPLRGKEAWAAAVEMLRRVGIPAPEQRAHDYPHQMSGGMSQRAMIAMALSCQPSLLIADEPTTALDVTIQLQILELLRDLQVETRMSILIITHDLGVVAEIADYVYVMYAGRTVEHASVRSLLTSPLHPYTQGLLRCTPRLSQRKTRLEVIPGQVPDPSGFPSGCRFHPRCRLSAELARQDGRHTVAARSEIGEVVLRRCVQTFEHEQSGQPELRELRPGHFVACWEADAF